MDKHRAQARYNALRNMTVDRGCTAHEAATAARIAAVLARQYGLVEEQPQAPARDEFDVRFARAEARAAYTYAWEYRTCGKRRCRCMRGGSPHGPYKYSKRRRGKKVVSIYRGL